MAAREEEDKFSGIVFNNKKKKDKSREAVWELRERGTEKVPEDSRSVVGECELDSWLTHMHTHSHACTRGAVTFMYTHPHTLPLFLHAYTHHKLNS